MNCISLLTVYVSSIYKERWFFSSFSLQIFISPSFVCVPLTSFWLSDYLRGMYLLLKANCVSSPQSACFQFFYFNFAVKTSFKPSKLRIKSELVLYRRYFLAFLESLAYSAIRIIIKFFIKIICPITYGRISNF